MTVREKTNSFYRSFCRIILGSIILSLSSCSPRRENIETQVAVDTETDFTLRMEEGDCVVGNAKLAQFQTGRINDITHWGIFEHAPCRIEFPDVYIGPEAYLEFSIGILEGAWSNPGDGVRFNIYALIPSVTEAIIYSRYIDPKKNPGERRWIDERIAIDSIQDTTATIVFETQTGETSDSNDANSDWAFWANPRLVSKGRLEKHLDPQKPNVILITLDTVRADYLGCYGNQWIQTPTIDRLAAEGALFKNAYAPCYHTNPSHLSFLTSVNPYVHGIIGNDQRLSVPLPCWPQIMKECGYTNLVAISAYHLENILDKSLGTWFDYYDKPPPMKIRAGSFTTGDVIRRLDKVHNEPFFYWIHYYDPHQPYQALGRYHRMYYEGDPTDPAHTSMENASFPDEWKADTPESWIYSYRDLDYFKKEYGAEISYTDAELGRLLGALKRLDLYDNTIIVLAADHGESLGDHGVYFDHWTPFNTDLHIPLIVWYPKKVPAGTRVKTDVSGIDAAPTVLDLIGEKNNFLAKHLFDGRSLKFLWQKNSNWNQRIVTSDGICYFNIAAYGKRYKAVWEMQRKVYNRDFQLLTGRVFIFDRQNDPGDTNPAAVFYWSDPGQRKDPWEKEKHTDPPAIPAAKMKEKVRNKQVPTADELRSWFMEKNGRDVLREDLLNDREFFKSAVTLLETMKQRVNPPTIRNRMKEVFDVSGGLGEQADYIQTADPAMKEFLRSLGYAGGN